MAGQAGDPDQIMIDATHLQAHGTAASLLKRGCSPPIGRTKGGLNSKLHVICDGQERPLVLLLSEGQMSDDKGAAFMTAPPIASGTRSGSCSEGSRNWRRIYARYDQCTHILFVAIAITVTVWLSPR